MGHVCLCRKDKHWCWGCSACTECKKDFYPRVVDEIHNIADCKTCKKQIKIVKDVTIRLDGEHFTFT